MLRRALHDQPAAGSKPSPSAAPRLHQALSILAAVLCVLAGPRSALAKAGNEGKRASATRANGKKGDLRAREVRVDARGGVTVAGRAFGRLALPSGKRTLRVTHPRVSGHTLLHIRVSGDGDRAAELLLEPSKRAELFRGSTGPQGVDGEWSLHLAVKPDAVLRFQRKAGWQRCDGEPTYLYPKLYDFKAGRFRPVSARVPLAGAKTIVAKRTPPAGLVVPPLDQTRLNGFRALAATTELGDGGSAANLEAPFEIDDGDPTTAWIEGRGGHGRGEMIIVRRPRSPHPVRAIRIIPGDAASRPAFARANRLRRLLLVTDADHSFTVRFDRDPLTADPFDKPYWIVLPKPVDTDCITLIVDTVYPGKLAHKGSGGGRTAIAELQLFTSLDFSRSAEKQLIADLAGDDPHRRAVARHVLMRLDKRAVTLLTPYARHAKGEKLRRIAELLARIGHPSAAVPLAALLARLDARSAGEVLRAMKRFGAAAVGPLLAELDRGSADHRGRVAAAIGRIGGEAARERLVQLAGRGPVGVRRGVVAGLAALPGPEVTSALVRAALAPDARARRVADLVLALGRRSISPDERHDVANRLKPLWPRYRSFEVRYRLLDTLGRLDAAGQIGLLRRAAGGAEPVLRWNAVRQLRRIEGSAALTTLRAALEDRDPRVRTTAALALGQRRRASELSVPLVHRLDRERWPMPARAIAEALGHHCSPAGNGALRRAIHRGQPGVDVRALISLVSCKPSGVGKDLLELAARDELRTALRTRALALLAPATARHHAATLAQLYRRMRREAVHGDAAERVAAAAALALGRSRAKSAAAALTDALALDPHTSIRTTAARALGQLCAPRSADTLRRAASSDHAPAVRHSAAASVRRCRF